MRWSNYLLWHHEIIRLSIHSLWALNSSHGILLTVGSRSSCVYRTNCRRSTKCSGIRYCILLYTPSSIRILLRDLWTISFHSNNVSTYSHNCLSSVLWIIETSCLIASLDRSTIIQIWVLISNSSTHHICWAIHNDIVLFNHSNSMHVLVLFLILLHRSISSCMILLCLNNMTTEHLWIFNFDLGIIKYVIVVIYILNYLYRLLLSLFLWLWWATSSLRHVELVWLMTNVFLASRITSYIFSGTLTWTDYSIACFSFLLIDYVIWIVYLVALGYVYLDIIWAAFVTLLIKIKFLFTILILLLLIVIWDCTLFDILVIWLLIIDNSIWFRWWFTLHNWILAHKCARILNTLRNSCKSLTIREWTRFTSWLHLLLLNSI